MLKFYCAPWSRASGVFWLLEELGQPYEIEIVDIRAPGGVPESYREIQPNKKVPAIDHDGTVVTERAAICIYLGDAFPEAGLAPPIGDKARAGYLTWLVYCDSVFDPAVAAKAQGWEYVSNNFSFGLFDDMVANVEKLLSRQPYAAGDALHGRRHAACRRHQLHDEHPQGAPGPAGVPRLCRAGNRPTGLSALCREGNRARQEGDAAAVRRNG